MKSNTVMIVGLFLTLILYVHAEEVLNAGKASRCLKVPPAESRCRAAKPAYFYDPVSKNCISFLYGGCSDENHRALPLEEMNVFTDLQDCMKLCGLGACPDSMCMMECPHGFPRDKNGCLVCECNASKPILAACELKACVKKCEYGYELDSRGCQTCTCKQPKIPPGLAICQTMACPDICLGGYVLDSRGCQTCECLKAPQEPKACPFIECGEACPKGYLIDSNGCETCECIKPNPNCVMGPMCMIFCEFGYKLDQQGCPRCSCATQPAPRRPECSPATCLMHCPGGFRKDSKGCPICSCAPVSDPCEVIDCKADEICLKDDTNPKTIKVRCVHVDRPAREKNTQREEEGFGILMAVIASIITFTLVSLCAAVCILICRRRQYRRRAEAIYKPVDSSSVHM